MRFPQTAKVMRALRGRAKQVRLNNQRISEWVDGYLGECVTNGRAVTVLTQWCISKDLEVRLEKQKGKFSPTKAERKLFESEVPAVAETFRTNGLGVSWWITFNRSYLDSGRINPEIERQYKAMVGELAEPFQKQGWLLITDWEDEVLRKRPGPNQRVLDGITDFVPFRALELEIGRHSAWAREEAGITQTDEELRRDVCYQIACEAEEGRMLSEESPIGEFILVPLEVSERYDLFSLIAKDFKRRIVPILHPYPWRLR